MKTLARIAVMFVSLLLLPTLGATAGLAAAGTVAPAKHYVCVACSLPCDKKVFDAPGTCPDCGMALVEQGSQPAPAADTRKKVAILVFNGVEIVDSTGPYEMFGAANYDVYTVAASKEAVTTAMGMTVVPKRTFADAPNPDVLVVPGGGVRGAMTDAATLAWVKDVTAHDRQTMSVCNGAFILAAAGLLDGLTATTTSGNIDRLAKSYPAITVVRDKRFVDNGHIVTTGGLSAGMDGALHVIEKLDGKGAAQSVALAEEYDWHSSPDDFARASFADTQVPDMGLDPLGQWDVERTEGNTEHWSAVFGGPSTLTAEQLLDKASHSLEEGGNWTPVRSAGAGSAAPDSHERHWTFTGRDGKSWKGSLRITNVESDADKRRIEMNVSRAG